MDNQINNTEQESKKLDKITKIIEAEVNDVKMLEQEVEKLQKNTTPEESKKLDKLAKIVETEVKDTVTLQKEIKKLQRELKREQRANKSADNFEKEMKAQKEELDAVIDTHMVYVLTQKDLIIKDVSSAFGDMFGYGYNEIIGQSYKMLVAHVDSEKFYNGCEYVSSHDKEGWGTDIQMLTTTNDTLFTHTFIYPSFVAGALNGFIFVIKDISNKILLNKFQAKVLANEKLDETTLDFVSSTSAAVLDTVSNKISLVVKIVVSFVFLFLIYAISFDIDEISRGNGQFIPTSKVQRIKNLEGGVVSAIYVNDGDSVKKGQILLKLSPISYQTKLDENKIRLLELKAKEARLKAESKGLPMENIVCDEDCDEKLIELEKSYYISNQKELNQNILKQKEKLKYQQSALLDAKSIVGTLKENYMMLKEEFDAKDELVKQKIFTKYEMGLLERELNDALSKLNSAKETIIQTKTQIAEIKNGIEETKLTFKNKAASAYSETIAEILRIEETKKNFEDIIKRTIVRSPVDGIVKELFVHTIGTSIQSSAEILTIVPDNYKMIAEIKMKPEEIAKLHVGQAVKLKVTAFDYSIYGDLEGKITNISPDTIIDKDTGDSHYLIYVQSKKNYLNNNEKYKIKVGMMVNADVLVGKKSIMSFLLKPILKTTQRN